MIAQSKVTSKGQDTLPKRIREVLGATAGDELSWSAGPDGSVVVRKITPRSLDDLAGMLGRPRHSATVEEMDVAIRERFRSGYDARR